MVYMDFINNSLKIYSIPESTESKIKKLFITPNVMNFSDCLDTIPEKIKTLKS